MLWSSGRRQALRRVPRDLWLATRSPSPAPNRNCRKVPGHHKGRIARKGTKRRRAPIDYREGGFNQGFHDRCGVSSTWKILKDIGQQIMKEENVSRVYYDMTPKPPGTIEFE